MELPEVLRAQKAVSIFFVLFGAKTADHFRVTNFLLPRQSIVAILHILPPSIDNLPFLYKQANNTTINKTQTATRKDKANVLRP